MNNGDTKEFKILKVNNENPFDLTEYEELFLQASLTGFFKTAVSQTDEHYAAIDYRKYLPCFDESNKDEKYNTFLGRTFAGLKGDDYAVTSKAGARKSFVETRDLMFGMKESGNLENALYALNDTVYELGELFMDTPRARDRGIFDDSYIDNLVQTGKINALSTKGAEYFAGFISSAMKETSESRKDLVSDNNPSA